MPSLKLIVLVNKEILLSQIEEVGSEIGEPDCKLINPVIIDQNKELNSWLSFYSDSKEFMIHSDKIMTISDPNDEFIIKYEEFLK